jgi:hypothetical protein
MSGGVGTVYPAAEIVEGAAVHPRNFGIVSRGKGYFPGVGVSVLPIDVVMVTAAVS